MSIMRRNSITDPFALEVFDNFDSLPFFGNGGNNGALSLPRPGFTGGSSPFSGARIDWKETPEAHVFKADLPGVKKGEAKVEVEEGRVLLISGERKREEEEKTDTWHRMERRSGKFLRRFRLPEDSKVDQVSAVMEDGVLTVTVPKEGVKRPAHVKSIQIS